MEGVTYQLALNGLISGFVYSLVGIGFSLIYKTTKIFHFAHACTFTFTAYSFYMLYGVWQVPIPAAFIISITLAAIFGVCTDIFIYEPLETEKASSLIKIISSLAVYIITISFLAIIFSSEPKVVSAESETIYATDKINVTRIQIISLIASLVVVILFFIALRKTKAGKIVRAMCDNSSLLAAVGFDLKLIRYSIFALGSALTGIAAVLLALDSGIEPTMGMPIFIIAVVAMIVGGVSDFKGVFIGALLIGLLQSLLVIYFQANWRELVVFAILMVFLFFRPQGIFGDKSRVEEKSVL